MNIKGAIFDMDGTLADSLGFWDMLWAYLGEKYLGDKSFRPDPITAKGVRTTTLDGAARLIHDNCKIGESCESVAKEFDEMLLSYYKEQVELKEDVREFLETLSRGGVKMCIASATSPRLLEALMEKFDLYKYFDFILSCAEIGKGKEEPDVFIEAHKRLGTEMEETWIFEDSVVAIETAVNAGYKTVGIYDKYNFGKDRVKEISTVYIDEGETLIKAIPSL